MPWTIDQIQKTRQTFLDANFQQLAVDVDGVAIVYFVIPHSWASKHKTGIPKMFAMRMTPTIEEMKGKRIADTTLFGVSDQVHHLWRPHYVRHEVTEYVSQALEHPSLIVDGTDTVRNGCLICSRGEWLEVQDAFELPRRREYVSDRLQFFEELIPFAKKPDSGFHEQSIKHFEASLEFWQQIALE